MSPSPIKVGFVGLSTRGWASTALAPSLLQPEILHNKYKLTAVSTTSKESASASAAKYTEELGHSITPYDGDTSKIASDPNVDLVVVSVKTPFHKSTALPIIEAKKSLFIEWPAGASLKETIDIAEAAHRQGVRTIVGLQTRQNLAVKKVKELIAAGKIGKVLSSSVIALSPQEHAIWGPRVAEASVYASDKKNGATVLSIPIGHQLDAFTYILGDFSTITAAGSIMYPVANVVDKDGNQTGKTITSNVLDHISFTGILKSGVFTSITWRSGYASTPGRRQLLWEIDGEDGSIRIESDEMSGAFIGIRQPKVYLNGEIVEIEGYSGLMGNLTNAWVEFAKGKEGDYATIDDAVKNHRILDAIERSIEEGKTIIL